MSLSHDATINMRPPAHINTSPVGYQNPSIAFLTDHSWSAVFTTFPLSMYKRKPRRDPVFRLRIDSASETYTMTESWIDPSDKPDPLEVEVRPRTSICAGKVLDGSGHGQSETEHRVSMFRQDETGRQWEVICWGKQGQLESWMIDNDDGWIGEECGERRPDWRNHYVVIYHQATAEKGPEIEVWDSIGRSRRLTPQTLQKIKHALSKIPSQEVAILAEKLVEIMPFKEMAASGGATKRACGNDLSVCIIL